MNTIRNDDEGYNEYPGIGRVYDNGKVQFFGPDGKTVLDPDTYYRGEDDYDTGGSYRKPGMPYVQLRRSSKEVIFSRAVLVVQFLMLAWLIVGYPLVFGPDSAVNAVLAVFFSAFGIYLVWDIFKKKMSPSATEESGRRATSLFDFQWHGRI